jgi:hypothetical protein
MDSPREDWKTDTISVFDAYVAMFMFLEQYYETTKIDEIGALLGGLSLLPDGNPIDPAYKGEWLEAVEHAKTKEFPG